jgi:hypothetical protein
MKAIATLLVIGCFYSTLYAQKTITVGKVNNEIIDLTLKGEIRDSNTGEGLIGATLYVLSLERGVSTDIKGNFELKIKKGTYQIRVSMIGYQAETVNMTLLSDGRHNFKLNESSTTLEEISITGERPDQNVKGTDMGKQVLNIKSIQELPSFVGEVDVLKSITLLPGVSTVGEVSSGFNVRGGSSDQNLILLGGATLYNPSHLFGFFSSFNADAISRVALYKGGIPAKYGGRGSSVLDIKYKNGHLMNWQGTGSIGSISAKALVEGPIIKNKLSILVSARTSYSDWILKQVKDPLISNSSASFYDVNGRLNYIVNKNNKISYTFYHSADNFSFSSDTSIYWSNRSHAIDWSNSNDGKLSFQVSLVNSAYVYSIQNKSEINTFDLESKIDNVEALIDIDYKLFNENTLNFGLQSKFTQINPGKFDVKDPLSALIDKELNSEKSLESSAFADLKIDITSNISISVGGRYTVFNYLGSNNIYEYEPYLPINIQSVVDSTQYTNNESIVKYNGIEPRVSLRWSLSESTSIKAGYNKMYQYIHLVSNTSAIAPTDIWKLSDPFIKPEIVTQYSLGIFKNFKDNKIETSAEVYFKETDNLVQYKDGAELILNNNLETELLYGIGRAYGLELFFKKKYGKLTGWLSYTYSRSLVQVKGAYDIEQINGGEWYSSNYDKPHDFTAVLVHKINKNWSISGNFTYSTGRPVTYPVGKFEINGQVIADFDERNSSRIPDYHRLDFSVTYKMPSRRKLWGGDWKFSIYNVYGRRNAFSVFIKDVNGSPPQPFKLSVLGIPFPSLSYNFKF